MCGKRDTTKITQQDLTESEQHRNTILNSQLTDRRRLKSFTREQKRSKLETGEEGDKDASRAVHFAQINKLYAR